MLPSLLFAALLTYQIVYDSRQYKLVGTSVPETWSMSLPDGQKRKSKPAECTPQEVRTDRLPIGTRTPENGEHWNYVTDVIASPDGKWFLVGSEAGPSGQKYADYWLFDRTSRTWQYLGGGNDAKWSPDSSKVLWSTARELAPLGKLQVWTSHLVLVAIHTRQQQVLTSGVSYESNFYWCTIGKQ